MHKDSECTVIYVDILGFANLTERFPTHLIHSGPDERGFRSSSSTETFNTFNRFHRILDKCVFDRTLNGPVRAMLFSDCAFLELGTSLLAAVSATELMRTFIRENVPVRMGIGKGTFYPFYFSTELTDSSIISRSRFIGTAVVRAHAAEKCGGKGLRIFVHPKLEGELEMFERRVKVIPLVNVYPNAKWELDFLHEQRPAQEKPSAEEADYELFEAVIGMQDETMPLEVHRHYEETINAMNRMRTAHSRPKLNADDFRN
jgi:hypothetical protein